MSSEECEARTEHAKGWVQALLWVVVPFPTYCTLIFLGQPWLFKAIYGYPMTGPIPTDAIGWTNIIITLLSIIAITVVAVVLAIASLALAKESAPLGGDSNGV